MTLYPIASSGSIDMLGDEFPDPQTFARPSPLTDEQRYADVLLRRKFMRETWGLSEEEIDRLEPDEGPPVNLLDAVRAAELTDLVCASIAASYAASIRDDDVPAMEAAE